MAAVLMVCIPVRVAMTVTMVMILAAYLWRKVYGWCGRCVLRCMVVRMTMPMGMVMVIYAVDTQLRRVRK